VQIYYFLGKIHFTLEDIRLLIQYF